MANNADIDETYPAQAQEQQMDAPVSVEESTNRVDSLLVELGRAALELFHAEHGCAFAQRREGDSVAFPVMGAECRYLLEKAHHEATGKYPKKGLVRDAQYLLAAEAFHERERREISVRVGGSHQAVWVDLGPRRAVQIVPGSWSVVERAEVMMRRGSGSLELPTPTTAGDGLRQLRKLFDFLDEDNYRLVLGWLLMAFSPSGPFPALVLVGEPGSGKTTLATMLKALVDPTSMPSRSAPRSEQDLAIYADNNRVISLDNLGSIAPWLSDALCRLLSGGGYSTRELYTTDDERIWMHQRPAIFNGLAAVVVQQDLLNRSAVVALKRREKWDDEAAVLARFEAARPAILGGLFDLVAELLERLPTTTEPHHVRMADWVRWITAAEPSLDWEPGSFASLLTEAQIDAERTSLEGSAIAGPLLAFMRSRPNGTWEGTHTDLLERLEPSGDKRPGRGWPANGQKLSLELTKLAKGLRQEGIEIERERTGGDKKMRWIRLIDMRATQGSSGTPGTHEDDA